METGSALNNGDTALDRAFISYATTDRVEALKICKAIERRGIACWISLRDVAPGANYQEAIVNSIRNARALILVFSEAANNSDEIKKELSLASRYRVPVMALRIHDVEANDAFAYELSTRQWIDAFDGWDRSIDLLVGQIRQVAGRQPIGTTIPSPARRRINAAPRRTAIAVASVALLLMAAGAAWWFLVRPVAAPHSMTVRLAGFKLLSPDLPATIRDTVDAEIAAAFNADGAVGVSTADAPAPGTAPAYALGGTIQRDGDKMRVITTLTNERSGTTLWTDKFDYDGKEVSKIPRYVAVDAGNVVRCGLFGASTYRKSLPDTVLRDYLQFCEGHWDPNLAEGRKALVPALRVVAAVPDFSWGWAGVAGAYWKVATHADNEQLAEEARASGRTAADRAVKIDPRNSEALYIKSVLLDRLDWVGREQLLKRAVAARRLDCGCEHHQYGYLLFSVGRLTEAVGQFRQANDTLALYVYTSLSLADALVATGKAEEAKTYFDAAAQLAPESNAANWIVLAKATATGDTQAILNPKIELPPAKRAALVAGFRAVAAGDAAAKAGAARALLALPQDQQRSDVALLLGALGADHEAFLIATRLSGRNYPGASLFWYPSMRGTLHDPGFPAVATKLRLIHYWKATRTRPDVCGGQAPPPFCRMI